MKATVGFGLLTLIALMEVPSASRGDDQFFRTRIAPILERRCVHCHGDSTRKANLSLSTASGAFTGGDGGPAIVAGKPGESLILEMISGDKPAMPQKDKPLTREEVSDIRKWIESGAAWPDGLKLADRRLEGQRWWAFEPLESPVTPRVHSPWVRTPIDAFVLAKLQQHGLKQSPEADRRTLIRRLSFDLIGLPPAPDEIEQFTQDRSANAYEALVDRLLASPHYGERWGRHWLDVAHYGDTHGYDKDKRRDHAWPYRDYVIAALNQDLPYGRFIREQVAGDVLFPADPRGVIATGFIAAGPWDFVGHVELREGTIDKLKTRLLDRDDMVASTISSFVSVTVHCARCHDHKFDPIPQSDYYRLQAVFAGVDRGDRPYSNPVTSARRAALEDRRKAVATRHSLVARQIASTSTPALIRLDEQIASLHRALKMLPPAAISRVSPSNGYHSAIHQKPDDLTWVQLDFGASVTLDEIRMVPARPTDFTDTPGFGFPPRFTVEISDDPTFKRADRIATRVGPDDQSAGDVPYIIRPAGRRARYIRITANRLWKRLNDYVFALAELEVISQGINRARTASVTALDSIDAGRWGRDRLIDGYDSRLERPETNDSTSESRNTLLFQLQQAQEKRDQLAEESSDPELKRDRDGCLAELATIAAQLAALPRPDLVYSIQQHAPRPITLLRRGEVDQPGALAPPGALSCMPFLPSAFDLPSAGNEGLRRAALAEWLASPKNVLTWRSIANRLWHYHFGRGIVETPSDFGRNGALPTHPELLDWLAAALRDNGQSLKALHRLIVCSAAYRQSASENAAFAAIDAENRFLWRQNRRRLDAEAVRDAVLAVAGVLDQRMGGPGFEAFSFKDDHSPIYDHSNAARISAPDVLRRAVYRFVVRSVPNPFMEALDCADPNLNTPVRGQTLTALQALALWNDLFILSQSKELAHRLERRSADIPQQVTAAFRLALGREPHRVEVDALATFAAHHSLAEACRVILNTNEFVFVD